MKISISKIKSPSQGRSERGRGNSPNGEKLEKIDLISKGSIFSKRFPKLVKNSIFLLNFDQKFSKFPSSLYYLSKSRKISAKINAWFANFLEKYAKLLHFTNILVIFLKIFENSLGAGDPQKSFLPDPNPGYVHVPSLCELKFRFTSSRFRFLQSYSLLFVSVLFSMLL